MRADVCVRVCTADGPERRRGRGAGGRGEGAGRRGVSVVAAAAGGGRGISLVVRVVESRARRRPAPRLQAPAARRELRAREASVALRPCSPARAQARRRVAGVGGVVLSRNIDIRAGAEVDRRSAAHSRRAGAKALAGGLKESPPEKSGRGRGCDARGRSRAAQGRSGVGWAGKEMTDAERKRDRKPGRRGVQERERRRSEREVGAGERDVISLLSRVRKT